MKPFIFDTMKEIIGDAKCKFIGEIGTHKGGTAQQLIYLLAPRVDKLVYWGYDIFDGDNPNLELRKIERNGKSQPTYTQAEYAFNKISKRIPNLEYKLHVGFTTDTLKPTKFDFVWIDGGHSYDTVKHDYNMVKDSKLMIFDDVKIPGVHKFVHELIDQGVDVEIVKTDSKKIWAVIRN